jgi:hypothetical protein
MSSSSPVPAIRTRTVLLVLRTEVRFPRSKSARTLWRPGFWKVTPSLVKNTCIRLVSDCPGCSTVVSRGPQATTMSSTCSTCPPGRACSSRRSPSARLRCLLTSRGSPPVFVSVISATTYSPIYTSSGSLSSSCIIGVDQAFGIGQLGKARGESAMTPAERFPARAHLRIGCVHQGAVVVVREAECRIAGVGLATVANPITSPVWFQGAGDPAEAGASCIILVVIVCHVGFSLGEWVSGDRCNKAALDVPAPLPSHIFPVRDPGVRLPSWRPAIPRRTSAPRAEARLLFPAVTRHLRPDCRNSRHPALRQDRLPPGVGEEHLLPHAVLPVRLFGSLF